MWISLARSTAKYLICLAIGLAFWGTSGRAIADLAPNCEVDCVYQTRSIHSIDGIGKFYHDREIAKVMGHQEMWWLERSTRQREEQPQQAIEALNLHPTDVVADIGAGTGYFSFRLAQKVPQGKVFAVDIQPEMVEAIAFLRDENQIETVEPILGTQTNPNLPEASIDLALMVDAYHEFAYPHEMMQGILSGLKPGGRVVLVEYRRENPFVPIKKLHKMSVTQVKKEMKNLGLVWVETNEILPLQHILVFQKPASIQRLSNK